MYKVEKKNYGVKFSFEGTISADEMTAWGKEMKAILPSLGSEFGVFGDMRTLAPLDKEAKKGLEDIQRLYKQKGLARSVLILSSAVQKMQLKRLARESGVDKWERYVDASTDTNWNKTGEEWIVKSVDPDRTPTPA